MRLDQEGPGRYAGGFAPDEPGVYLVRARSGADLVSAGMVHSVSGEAATGQINEELMRGVAELTGGTVLAEDAALPAGRAGHARFVELRPYLLQLLLLAFLADLAIRRWENVLGMAESLRRVARRS